MFTLDLSVFLQGSGHVIQHLISFYLLITGTKIQTRIQFSCKMVLKLSQQSTPKPGTVFDLHSFTGLFGDNLISITYLLHCFTFYDVCYTFHYVCYTFYHVMLHFLKRHVRLLSQFHERVRIDLKLANNVHWDLETRTSSWTVTLFDLPVTLFFVTSITPTIKVGSTWNSQGMLINMSWRYLIGKKSMHYPYLCRYLNTRKYFSSNTLFSLILPVTIFSKLDNSHL